MENTFEVLIRRINKIEALINLINGKIDELLTSKKSKERDAIEFIDIDTVARITGYKKGYIYLLVHKNAIPFIKRGHKLFFVPEDIQG